MIKQFSFRKNPYQFLGPCDRLRLAGNEDLWQKMMLLKIPISMSEFEVSCQLDLLLDEGETLMEFIAGDPESNFFISFWGDQPCMFLQTHGFEFIFI